VDQKTKRMLKLLETLHESGVVSSSRLRMVRIHCAYWELRAADVHPTPARDIVADAFGVTPDTVETYAKRRNRYSLSGEVIESSLDSEGQ